MTRKPRYDDEMRSHYDFSGGERGKYAARYAEGMNVVVLDPDVPEVSPDSIAANDALRTIARTSATAAKAKALPKMRSR